MFHFGDHGSMSEMLLGCFKEDDVLPSEGQFGDEYSKYNFGKDLRLAYNNNNVLPEGVLAGWYAMLQNNMQRNT